MEAKPGRQESAKHGNLRRLVSKLDCGVESVCTWVRLADFDGGQKPSTMPTDTKPIRALEWEDTELERADEVLRPASAPRMLV